MPTRIALFSDINGNLPALHAVLSDIDRRTEARERELYDLDRAIDAGAEAARGGDQHLQGRPVQHSDSHLRLRLQP